MTRGQRMRRQDRKMPRSRRERETHKETEAQKVYGWRLRCLKRAGMPPMLAMRVADSPMDLHTAVAALEAGCSPETLVEIAI